MRLFKETFGVICLMVLIATALAEKNPGVDSRPCYTAPTDLGKVVIDLTRRVGELEQKVNRLEREHK